MFAHLPEQLRSEQELRAAITTEIRSALAGRHSKTSDLCVICRANQTDIQEHVISTPTRFVVSIVREKSMHAPGAIAGVSLLGHEFSIPQNEHGEKAHIIALLLRSGATINAGHYQIMEKTRGMPLLYDGCTGVSTSIGPTDGLVVAGIIEVSNHPVRGTLGPCPQLLAIA